MSVAVAPSMDILLKTGMEHGMEASYARLKGHQWGACLHAPPRFHAVSPCGSSSPCARQVAVSVLAKRHAMVIGPTPPGTGVIAPATSAALAK